MAADCEVVEHGPMRTGMSSRSKGACLRPVYLAAVGDVNRVETWSGIPYHFLLAAQQQGLIQHGLRLASTGLRWRLRRVRWNALQVLRGQRYGGYQYSIEYLERLWRPARAMVKGGTVINCFQLYPQSVAFDRSVERWYFLDQTLKQMLDEYGSRHLIGERTAVEAVERERTGYQSAAGIIVHSKWAAYSLTEAYGVEPSKVHVVVPGANLDPVEYKRWESTRSDETAAAGPLRLVFVGKEWRRKGLDRLLLGLLAARARGAEVTLRVIGCAREALPTALQNTPCVEWFGFVNKRTEARRFLQSVAECDVGCLLSRAEAGGMSLREYHALGLSVLVTDAGGAPEHALQDASIPVPVEAGSDEIGRIIAALACDRERVSRLRAAAWRQRHSVSWRATVENILRFWPHEVSQLGFAESR